MNNKRTWASLAMLVGAIIWGSAFVFQNLAMEHMGPFTLGATRFLIGSLVILPLVFVKKLQPDPATDPPFSQYLKSGVICGVFLFLGVTFQQYGIMYTTAGKAGFVTALYMVMVPFFAWALFKRKVSKVMWVVVLVALAGTFLLCISETLSIQLGDVLVFIGAIFWAFQILALERLGQNLDSFKLSIIQFMTCAVLSAIPMFLLEHPTMDGIVAGIGPILYVGILSVGVAFTAQTVCLKYADAIVATLIMSTEAVFAAIFGFLILGETLTWRQILGCVLVFAAVVMSELLPKLKKPADA